MLLGQLLKKMNLLNRSSHKDDPRPTDGRYGNKPSAPSGFQYPCEDQGPLTKPVRSWKSEDKV